MAFEIRDLMIHVAPWQAPRVEPAELPMQMCGACTNCSNCSGCSVCTGCSDCTDCSICTDCSNCTAASGGGCGLTDCGDCSYDTGICTSASGIYVAPAEDPVSAEYEVLREALLAKMSENLSAVPEKHLG